MAALIGLYEAIMNSNFTILILSPTQRQSDNLFRRMKYFVNKNTRIPKDERIPVNNMIIRETQTIIEFDNGSIIYSLPATEDASNIRGFTAHIIIIDEAAYVNDKVYNAIRPMLITTKGKLILLGSPNGVNNYFHKAFSDTREGFSVHHFPSRVSPLISDEELEREKETLPDLVYRQEYDAEFVESAGAVFPAKLVDSSTDYNCPTREKPLVNVKYYLGYDPARMGTDEAVALILEDRETYLKSYPNLPRYVVVNMFAMKNKTLDYQVSFIKSLYQTWRFNKIVLDATGVGGGVFDSLKEEGLPIEAFNFTIKSKPEVYFHAVRMMESKQVVIPPDNKLRKQLMEMRQEKREGSDHIRIYHPAKTGEDDYATAFVLSLWATKKKTVPVLFGVAKTPFFGG